MAHVELGIDGEPKGLLEDRRLVTFEAEDEEPEHHDAVLVQLLDQGQIVVGIVLELVDVP